MSCNNGITYTTFLGKSSRCIRVATPKTNNITAKPSTVTWNWNWKKKFPLLDLFQKIYYFYLVLSRRERFYTNLYWERISSSFIHFCVRFSWTSMAALFRFRWWRLIMCFIRRSLRNRFSISLTKPIFGKCILRCLQNMRPCLKKSL